MDKRTLAELERIAGKDNLKTALEELVCYSYDGYLKESLPDAVVFPESTEQVSAIVKLAGSEGFFITSRGSGSNLCGASVPKKGGLVLAFSRMCRTIKIDREERFAIIEPGKVLDDLELELSPLGLSYPVDLGSSKIATIGGSIALNSGGMKAIKYGVTRDYLLGLTVVLADGSILELGTKTKKNVVGYDLMSLFCGSEGTLGIITQAVVKLVVKPKARKVIVAHFRGMESACAAVNEVLASGLIPAAIEIIDRLVIGAVEDYAKAGLDKAAEALLLIELDGKESVVEEDSRAMNALLDRHGAYGKKEAATAAESDKLWLARKSAFPSMTRLKNICIAEDITVPVSRLYEVITRLNELSVKNGVLMGLISHSGDGNLHPHFLIDNKEEELKADRVLEELTPFVISIGGTLSGEHGIGVSKKKFLGFQLKENELRIMRELKKLYDPKGILNPGSFID